MATKQQHWSCEVCGTVGAVEYGKGGGDSKGAMSTINAILDDHSDRAPRCSGDSWTIRLGARTGG